MQFNAKAHLLFTLLMMSLALNSSEEKNQQSQRPNILLISVDDLNDWVGVLGGHSQVKTPNIDRLASEGMLFANAHAQVAICNPSRTSIMTSLYPSTTGVYFNDGDIKDSPVANKSVVMTRRFEKEGYYVTGAGKLYHKRDKNYMANYAGNFGSYGPIPERKLTSFSGVQLWDWGAYPDRDNQMPDYKIAEWGVKQLNNSYDQPFFLGVGFIRPHVPLYVPQKWIDQYPIESIQLPNTYQKNNDDIATYALNLLSWEQIYLEPTHEWIVKNNQWRNLVQAYLASITFVDHQIGKVLNALEDSPHKDNTYTILFSDHGFHLGEKETWGKQTLWENSTRVPLIMVGPGIPEGKVSEKPVQLLDIYPTLLELSGLKADSKLEGHSLVQLLKDPEAVWPNFARSSFGPGNYAIRSERYRYIQYNDGSRELYDYKKDPHEWNNLVSDHKYTEIINQHKAYLPEEKAPILGSGSTGHKVYKATKELMK